MVAATIVVLTRLIYKQFFTQVELGLDDWAILVTLFCCIPSAYFNVKLADNGIGKDIWTLTPATITEFGFTFWVITILYFSEVFLLKLSILFFYLRIFPTSSIRRLLWGTIVIDILFGMAFIFTAIFQCAPISYYWTNWNDATGEGGTCADASIIAWANAAISIALDIWMIYLPLSQVPGLNLHWKKKLGVAASELLDPQLYS